MNYTEAQEHALKVRWKISLCQSGEACWCRIIEPEETLKDDEDNEIYIAGSGCVPKIYAEHIVKLHNASLISSIEESLMDEAVDDVMTICALNDESTAKKLVKDQFVVIAKLDLTESLDEVQQAALNATLRESIKKEPTLPNRQ